MRTLRKHVQLDRYAGSDKATCEFDGFVPEPIDIAHAQVGGREIRVVLFHGG